MSQIEEHIAKLIFLHFQGKADDSQEQELLEWRKVSARHEEMFMRLNRREYWEENYRRFIKSDEEHEKGWQKLEKRLNGFEKKTIGYDWWAYAAVVILLLTVGGGAFFVLNNHPETKVLTEAVSDHPIKSESHAILTLADGTEIDLKNEIARLALVQNKHTLLVSEEALSYQTALAKEQSDEFHTLTVPRGGEYILVLADGSKVYLNADSRLTFPVHFNGKERKVYLEGEAYFQIVKNPQKPFVVEVAPLKVEVLGTTFGVRSYREENNIRTTLETGKVKVYTAGKEVELLPSKQALFNKVTAALEVKTVDTELFLAWKDGRLVFDNCPLGEILTELSRWYDFEVCYVSESLKELKFSLNMQKHTTFREVLGLIEATEEVRFDVQDRMVIVK